MSAFQALDESKYTTVVREGAVTDAVAYAQGVLRAVALAAAHAAGGTIGWINSIHAVVIAATWHSSL